MFSAAIKLQLARADQELRAIDHHCNALVGLDDKVRVLHTDPDFAVTESHPQLECRPRSGRTGSTWSNPARGRSPANPKGKGLPEASHGGEMQARRSGTGQIIEVHTGGETQRIHRLVAFPRPGEQGACVAGDSELPWAVRGS